MIDPRGPRFGAAVTTVVLALVLITGAAWLLAIQAIVFALGAFAPDIAPYGRLYARLIRPRLAPPAELEDPAPPRFAQAVGLAFSVVGLVGLLTGVTALAYAAIGAALAAAFLNAAFGFCLGCEIYLVIRRLSVSPRSHPTTEVIS